MNQYGSSYNLNEMTYKNTRNHATNLKNIKYIAGPVSIHIIYNKKYDKKIFMFGDHHSPAEKFKCDEKFNPLIDKSTSTNTIYLPDYMEYYFSKHIDYPIDVFTELDFDRSETWPGLLESIRRKFESKNYPNVAFHKSDIRSYTGKDQISIFNKFMNYIELASKNNLNKNRSKYKKQLIDTLSKFRIVVENYNDKKILKNYHSIFIPYFGHEDDIKVIDETIDFIQKYVKNGELFTDLLTELKYKIMMCDDSSDVDEKWIDIIEKYIGNKNGIYLDIDRRFWKLISRSDKIKNNMDPIIYKNYEPNLLSAYLKFDSIDCIKEIMTRKKITLITALLLYGLIIMYGSALMDVYLIGSVLKGSGKDVFIIAGDRHIKTYLNFFKSINSEIIYESVNVPSVKLTMKYPSKRCVTAIKQLS